jgi:hypothetical protein
LKIQFSFCKDAKKKNCFSAEKLANKNNEVDGLFISFIYPEIIFDADDYKKPFNYTFRNHYNFYIPNKFIEMICIWAIII